MLFDTEDRPPTGLPAPAGEALLHHIPWTKRSRSPRVQIEPDDIDQLLLGLGIAGERERLHTMGLQRARGPDSLHRRGGDPRSCRHRPATPNASSRAGSRSSVSRTISSTFAAGMDGLRPRPRRTAAKFFSPSSTNRSGQLATVAAATWTSLAIRVFANPSAAISDTRVRCTSRSDAVGERISFSSTERCSSVTGSPGVGARIPHPTNDQLIVGQSTSYDGRLASALSREGQAVAEPTVRSHQ